MYFVIFFVGYYILIYFSCILTILLIYHKYITLYFVHALGILSSGQSTGSVLGRWRWCLAHQRLLLARAVLLWWRLWCTVFRYILVYSGRGVFEYSLRKNTPENIPKYISKYNMMYIRQRKNPYSPKIDTTTLTKHWLDQ